MSDATLLLHISINSFFCVWLLAQIIVQLRSFPASRFPQFLHRIGLLQRWSVFSPLGKPRASFNHHIKLEYRITGDSVEPTSWLEVPTYKKKPHMNLFFDTLHSLRDLSVLYRTQVIAGNKSATLLLAATVRVLCNVDSQSEVELRVWIPPDSEIAQNESV